MRTFMALWIRTRTNCKTKLPALTPPVGGGRWPELSGRPDGGGGVADVHTTNAIKTRITRKEERKSMRIDLKRVDQRHA